MMVCVNVKKLNVVVHLNSLNADLRVVFMCGNDLLKAGTLVVITDSHNTSSWTFHVVFPFEGGSAT